MKELCRNLADVDLGTTSSASIHRASKEVVAGYETDNLFELFDCFKRSTGLLFNDNGKIVKSRPTPSVILSDFEEAFKTPYYDSHAMAAFSEYLDRRWLTMVYGPSDVPNSYCGTIVQSSCTGKSRLVAEYPLLHFIN